MSNTLPREHLSAAARIDVGFLAKDGITKNGSGSGFWVKCWQEDQATISSVVFITNRHVVDYWYNSREYGYRLSIVRCRELRL